MRSKTVRIGGRDTPPVQGRLLMVYVILVSLVIVIPAEKRVLRRDFRIALPRPRRG